MTIYIVFVFITIISFTIGYLVSFYFKKVHIDNVLPFIMILMQHVPGNILELGANIHTSPYYRYINGYKRSYTTIDVDNDIINQCIEKCDNLEHKFIKLKQKRKTLFCKRKNPWKRLSIKSFFAVCIINNERSLSNFSKIRNNACVFVLPCSSYKKRRDTLLFRYNYVTKTKGF